MNHRKAFLDFEKYFDKLKEKFSIPGCSICITKGEEVIMSSGFGFKEMENNHLVDEKTQFFLASNTKAFVSLSVALLVDEGKLEWDKPVKEYIPWFKLHDEYATNRVTLRDILSHQTGLPDIRVSIDMDKFETVQLQRKEIVRKLQYVEPTYDMRTKLQYNNTMYTVATYLIGEVSGMPWEDFVIGKILQPLGMNSTFFNKIKAMNTGNCSNHYYFDNNSGKIKKYHSGDPGDDPEKYNPFGAAGSMTSTAFDMKNYLIMLSNNGVYKNEIFVSSENLKQMFKSNYAENWDDPFTELGNSAAGLGWFRWGYRGHKLVEHPGAYGSMILIMPDQKLGISIFPNLSNQNISKMIAFNIFDRMLGLDQIDWIDRFARLNMEALKKGKEKFKKDKIKKIEGTILSHELRDYSGRYENDLDGIIQISYKDNKLYIDLDKSETNELVHYHYDTFKVHFQKWDYSFYINFLTGFDGRINKLIMSDDRRILNKVDEE